MVHCEEVSILHDVANVLAKHPENDAHHQCQANKRGTANPNNVVPQRRSFVDTLQKHGINFVKAGRDPHL